MIWVGVAGPATNVAWALVIIALMKIGISTGLFLPGGRLHLNYALYTLLFRCLQINIVLLVFNMLPIPPLDGSRIVEGVLPDEHANEYAKIKPYGFMILILLLSAGWLHPRLNILGWLLSSAVYGVMGIFSLPM